MNECTQCPTPRPAGKIFLYALTYYALVKTRGSKLVIDSDVVAKATKYLSKFQKQELELSQDIQFSEIKLVDYMTPSKMEINISSADLFNMLTLLGVNDSITIDVSTPETAFGIHESVDNKLEINASMSTADQCHEGFDNTMVLSGTLESIYQVDPREGSRSDVEIRATADTVKRSYRLLSELTPFDLPDLIPATQEELSYRDYDPMQNRRVLEDLDLMTMNDLNYKTVEVKDGYPFIVDGLENSLCFNSDQEFTINIADNAKHWDGILEWTTGIDDWEEWDGQTVLNSYAGKLYLRGTGNSVITGSSNNYRWVLTGTNIRCDGNIETLLHYALVASGQHPTMANYCYSYMFYGCTSLTTAPALPATTLANSCYYGMFYNCTSLTAAPALPATTLAASCYSNMFQYCTSLTTAPALPATTLASGCYSSMFQNCTSLTTAPALPATTMVGSCYFYMFRGCTSLTTAPALPATTLANYCYYEMFYCCTHLKLSTSKTDEYQYEYRIPTSGSGTTATNALTNMFAGTGGTYTDTPEINTTYYCNFNPVSA